MAKKETQVTVTGRYIGGGIFEPREDAAGKKRYNALIVLDEGQEKKIEAAMLAAKKEKWGDKKVPGLQEWGPREGDDPEFENTYERLFINPKSTRKPGTMVKRDGVMHEVKPDDNILYPGCYVAVSLDAYGMEGDKQKKIPNSLSLSLRGILFRKHGERIGDVFDAEGEFGDFEDSDDPDAGAFDDGDGLD